MKPLHMLVIPAETHPSDHSFLEEVHTRGSERVERTFFMRSTTATRHQTLSWNHAKLEIIPHRPDHALLAWLSVYAFDARYLTHLWRIARRDRPDAVFVRDLTFSLLFALALRPIMHWTVIYQRSFPHEFGWFDPQRVRHYRWPWLYRTARRGELWLLRRLLGHADAVVPISERMGAQLIAEGICRPERLHAFGMGVTHRVLEVGPPPEREPGGPLSLVYVGTLTLRRRLDRLVEAVVLARRGHGVDVALTVLGGTDAEVEALRSVVERHGAANCVSVRGRIPRDEVYEAMARHHAGAIYIARDPRFMVASTTKLVESLAIGLPCVCTDAVAMHEELARKTGAIVMTDDTAEGYAAGIARLAADWPAFAARARAAREPVHDEYSYDRARERLDELVIRLVRQGRKAGAASTS